MKTIIIAFIILFLIVLIALFFARFVGEIFSRDDEFECTLEPYCNCEDCQNYRGGLPIDRL